MENFDQDRYIGHWYEIKRDWWNVFTIMADCVTKEFEENEDGNVDLYFRVNQPIWGYYGATGTLYDCPIGDCKATMGENHPRERASDFDIFYTDYDNFEVSYNCWDWKTMFGDFHYEMLSITSREETMSDEVLNKAKAVISEKLPWYYDFMFGESQKYGMFKWLFPNVYDTPQGDQCNYEWHLKKLDKN